MSRFADKRKALICVARGVHQTERVRTAWTFQFEGAQPGSEAPFDLRKEEIFFQLEE